ncbi:MAG: SRPBCC family protein [Rhodomicrobium sp.]
MATVRKEIATKASPSAVWAALRDVGALHTRLVPGFVTDTRLEPGARIVTFADGRVVREPIVAIDDEFMRVVWSAESSLATHFNGAAQVFAMSDGSAKIIWIADFLPHEIAPQIDAAMSAGAAAMNRALDRLAAP